MKNRIDFVYATQVKVGDLYVDGKTASDHAILVGEVVELVPTSDASGISMVCEGILDGERHVYILRNMARVMIVARVTD